MKKRIFIIGVLLGLIFVGFFSYKIHKVGGFHKLKIKLGFVKIDDPYKAYTQIKFKFEGHDATVIIPKSANKNLWIWRTYFLGVEPQTDLALLKNGFYVVYIDAPDLFGNNEAIMLFNDYYKYLIKKFGLNSKCVLEGFSRGGLYAYNWASRNTDKVFCIYTDAPVCDLNSWPGGKGRGEASPEDWKKALSVYGLNERSVMKFQDMPIYNCISIAKAKIPVLSVCGDKDITVPIEENTYKVAKILSMNGDEMQLIIKRGVGHHPHSLKNPKPIVDFIMKNTITK